MVVAGSVCKKWRHLTMSTASLWPWLVVTSRQTVALENLLQTVAKGSIRIDVTLKRSRPTDTPVSDIVAHAVSRLLSLVIRVHSDDEWAMWTPLQELAPLLDTIVLDRSATAEPSGRMLADIPAVLSTPPPRLLVVEVVDYMVTPRNVPPWLSRSVERFVWARTERSLSMGPVDWTGNASLLFLDGLSVWCPKMTTLVLKNLPFVSMMPIPRLPRTLELVVLAECAPQASLWKLAGILSSPPSCARVVFRYHQTAWWLRESDVRTDGLFPAGFGTPTPVTITANTTVTVDRGHSIHWCFTVPDEAEPDAGRAIDIKESWLANAPAYPWSSRLNITALQGRCKSLVIDTHAWRHLCLAGLHRQLFGRLEDLTLVVQTDPFYRDSLGRALPCVTAPAPIQAPDLRHLTIMSPVPLVLSFRAIAKLLRMLLYMSVDTPHAPASDENPSDIDTDSSNEATQALAPKVVLQPQLHQLDLVNVYVPTGPADYKHQHPARVGMTAKQLLAELAESMTAEEVLRTEYNL